MPRRLGLLASALAITAACSSTPSGTSATKPGQATASAHTPAEVSKFKEIVIPAGTTLNLTLETAISSNQSRPEDPVRATLSRPIVIDRMTAVAAGAEATGSILEARESGRVK